MKHAAHCTCASCATTHPDKRQPDPIRLTTMYYATRIIDGVLHWRTYPDAEWTPFSARELTARLQALSRCLKDLTTSLEP